MNPTNSPDCATVHSLAAADPEINATVSASAGTGKTWLLVTRIIRLLLADTAPGSILALTFTRKAAAEMQIRLQERLYLMATADDEELSGLLKQAGCRVTAATMSTSRVLYERLLHADFPVRLQTFHSFCQDILSHFPLEADVIPGFELLEDTALLQQQAWEELFAEVTRNARGRLANDLDILMRACKGPASTRTALYSMLNHRSDWWAFCENRNDPAAHACGRLQRQLQVDSGTVAFAEFFSSADPKGLERFAGLLRQHPTGTNLGHAERIEQALAGDELNEDTFRQLLPVFLTARNEPRSRKPSKAQAAGMGAEGEAVFLDLHRRIGAAMQHTLEIDRRVQTLAVNAVWYRLGQRFIEIYQKLKREQRVLDFTDLEWNCYRLLNHVDNAHWVQYKIDQRINHVLIDEFQDTNPTQWQLITPLLEEIAAGPRERARSFFLVGDEKQSIYSFRRANPELQQRASEYLARGMAAVDVKLDSSRRSSPAIITAVNAIFDQEAVRRYMPEYTVHTTHMQRVPGRVSLFPLHRIDDERGNSMEKPDDPILRNPLLESRAEHTVSARSAEAHQIAREIGRLVTQNTLITEKGSNDQEQVRAVEYGDIMILMRNRTHIGEYEAVLREHGIPFIGSQRGSLLENQEIQNLEKLLDSLMTPFDNLAIAQILKSPIFAASDDDLLGLSLIHEDKKWYQRLSTAKAELDDDHPLKRAARLLPRWHRLADTIPVHDLIDRIYAEGNIMQRYAASVPVAQRQQVTANLLRFHELSLELDSGRYPSLSRFLHYLRSIRVHSDARPDEPAAAEGRSSVRLMTIHASKGLEAPVVFLADCDNQGGHHNAYSALVDWPAHSTRPTRFQLLATKAATDQMTGSVLTQKEAAQKREELNLLYVAITRARQYLIVTGTAGKQSSGWHELIETGIETLTAPDSDGCYHYATGSYSEERVAAREAQHPPQSKVPAELRRPIHDTPPAERIVAPSLGYNDGNDAGEAQRDSEATRRGMAIHRALDLMTREPPLTSDQARQRIRHESAIADDLALDQWIDEASRTIANSDFSAVFKPAAGRRILNEMPLMYRDGGRSVSGIVDRLIISDDGILLIDYKTHQLDDLTQLDAIAARFEDQMQLYRKGVARIWPGLKIKSGLLFTHSARLVWLNQNG